MIPEISCDRCAAPGTCCKSFPLSAEFPIGSTHETVQAWLAKENLPFNPIRRQYVYPGGNKIVVGPKGWYENWLFTCTKVTPEGRCSIYEDRPTLCKIYEPGMDAMCVHMRMPNGEPILPLLPVSL